MIFGSSVFVARMMTMIIWTPIHPSIWWLGMVGLRFAKTIEFTSSLLASHAELKIFRHHFWSNFYFYSIKLLLTYST